MKTILGLLLVSLLYGVSVPAQTLIGRWEAEEVSLEITTILKAGILEVKQPHFGSKPARNRLVAEFWSNGTFRMNGEPGKYRQQGNEVYADVNGKTEVYTVYRTGDQLQLWGPNVVASQNQQERTATAIMMTRQMGMQDKFEFLQPTDRVSSIRLGTHFRYVGEGQPAYQSQGNAYSAPNRVDCVVSSADLDRIKERVEAAAFDTDKPKILKAALAAKRCFSTDQILELLALFTFDSDKLPLAKYAYSYVTDRENYDQITDAFDFDTSKDELRTFIRSRR
ncbi:MULTISPECIES: DUF4476 domain-containing protein [unclassified Spirosoma]|uniref:DUF4476 domain-containing protein n=1 Tax=unclassified Spirosoma TaxID=2621999 RepID=UPI0009666DF5|nr:MULTISPECIES: DUF4476 domain-containing protein [unclassified Spirosoma]MBN8821125.1 DUF4476 domain-containing protein [Spirosoma sp.]OJW79240.1 MAG: hypothetical protein BGO59_11900 [Spirosoma sp. 48-14]